MGKFKLEEAEKLCMHGAMDQWRKSLKRPDMQEEDRVKGAIKAYQSQFFALQMSESVQGFDEVQADVLRALNGRTNPEEEKCQILNRC